MSAGELKITAEQLRSLREQARRLAPEEACGLLAGRDGQVEALFFITNSLHSPVRFSMEPREQLRAFQAIDAAGLQLLAIYHSHPSGPAGPSPVDLADFAYPGVLYVILDGRNDQWRAAAFELDEKDIREVTLTIVAGA
jgi:proteasome lid subunit RPN8/RPN11